MKKALLAVFALLTLLGEAQAQQSPTLREALNQTLDEAAKRCPLRNQFNEPRHPEARQKFLTEKTNAAVCECFPRNVRNALETLPEEDLARQVNLEKMRAVMPDLLHPCLAVQFREMFGGDHCVAMLPANAPPVREGFCACMKPEVVKLSDAEAVELGTAAQRYAAAVEEAHKSGRSPPPRAPLIQRFQDSMKRCAGWDDRH